MPNRLATRKGFLRAVACVFFVYHMAAAAIANLSTTTAVGSLPHRWFRPYTTLLGLWQEWDMFTTIPYYLDIRPKLVARFFDNSKQEFGPMLPGLDEAPESLKVSSLFARVMWSRSGFATNVSRWERAACSAVRRETNHQPKSINLELSTLRLNTLAQVQATGVIAHPEQFSTHPAPCKR